MIASHHVARALSLATGMPMSAVMWRLQLMKKAGVLPKDGPGTAGHVPLTPRDLAVCLLGMAAPMAKDAPAVIERHGALPFASLSEAAPRIEDGHSEPSPHAAEVFGGLVLEVLARLLTEPTGRAVAGVAVTTGPAARVGIHLPVAVAQYAPADVAAHFPGAAAGCRRSVTVHLGRPAFTMLRGLIEADAHGADLDNHHFDSSAGAVQAVAATMNGKEQP